VSAAGDGSIVVWDAQNGRRLLTLRQHGPRGARPRWEPDGRRILASTARDVTIWSASTGQRLQTLRSPRGTIEAAQWQPHDRTHILTAAAGHPSSQSHEWNDDGIARLWDARSGTVVASLDTTYPLRDAFFDDQGTAVVTIPQFGAAHVWYPKTGRAVVLRSRGAPTWPVADAAFNHSGERIATTTTNERNVRIWDARTGAVDAVLTGHASYVTAIEFSPDDSTVATTSNDRSARTWDARTGDLLSVLRGHDSRISGLAFPTAELIATAGTDGDVRLWRTGAKQLAGLKLQAFGDVSFSHDGRLVVATTYQGVEIRPWKPDAAGRRVVIREPVGINTASLSPDGHLVVVAGPWSRPSAPARVLHVPDGRIIGRPLVAGPANGAVTAAFSPDGQLILTAHRDGAARLWSSRSHRLLRRFGPTGPPSDRTALRDAQFSSDGRRIVTVGGTGAVRVFDTASGRQLQSLSSPRREPGGDFHAATFQPGGANLATVGADGLALLWNLKTGESRALPADDSVNGVAFSPDGALLATSSWDGTARLWTATGYPLGPLQRARQAVMSVAFSRDGHRLVTADDRGMVRVFDCEVCGSVNDLQRTARARVSRRLTRQERREYVGEDDNG
jgi:WD40 repeat protein